MNSPINRQLLAFCALVALITSGSAFAQTGSPSTLPSIQPSTDTTILVNGDPPLTRAVVENVIGYFSWLLQIAMPAEQRQFIYSSLVKSWQAGNREDMQGALTFAVAYVKIFELDAQKQTTLRDQLLPGTLEGLRAQPNHPFARGLLAAYSAAHPPDEAAAAAADATRKASGQPAVGLPRGKGRFNGLYRAVVAVSENPLSPRARIKYAYVIFFSDGRFMEGFPTQGLEGFNEDTEIRINPVGWGTYDMTGDVGKVVFPPGEFSKQPIVWAIKEYSDRLLVHGDTYHLLDRCNGLKLQGTFRLSNYQTTYAAKQGITFTLDGTFMDEGVFKAAGVMVRDAAGNYDFDDGALGHGTYRVANYTLELTYSNGVTKRTSFYIDPDMSKTQVREFYLNTSRFARVQ